MRRKAKELQQARRDAERRGTKAPGFGGFGSSAVSGGTTAAMITETIIETDKPKVTPAATRSESSPIVVHVWGVFFFKGEAPCRGQPAVCCVGSEGNECS